MILGDTLTCNIESLSYGGDGIARIDGFVVFIPETITGETVTARITQIKKTFARAIMLTVITPSLHRIIPCCRVNNPDTDLQCRVPGCVYDHLDATAELHAKQKQLEGFISKLTRHTKPLTCLPPHPAPASLHYRNKIVLHTRRDRHTMRFGYHLKSSHKLLDIAACPLACDPINATLETLRHSDNLNYLQNESNVTFRYTPYDGTLWWEAGQSTHTKHPAYLTEMSVIGPVYVPREGFYQVNVEVGDALIRDVVTWFSEHSINYEILDLYCGMGIFGFACMAAGGSRLTGIESGRTAVEAARNNAIKLGMPATFHCQELGVSSLSFNSLINNPKQTAVILDPPRDGMTPRMTLALANSGIARIFYISCDPATLTRDLTLLIAEGHYQPVRARLFNLFPRTAHFETLVELCKI